MNYVGQVSGWQQGPINAHCVVTAYRMPPPNGTRVAVLCADVVTGSSTGGNSGAPVFELTGHPNDVKLWGIVIASAPGEWLYARIEGIKFDLCGLFTRAPPVIE